MSLKNSLALKSSGSELGPSRVRPSASYSTSLSLDFPGVVRETTVRINKKCNIHLFRADASLTASKQRYKRGYVLLIDMCAGCEATFFDPQNNSARETGEVSFSQVALACPRSPC